MRAQQLFCRRLLGFICLTMLIQQNSIAQSITGKWKLTAMTGFIIYKSTGKKVDLSLIKTDQVFTFTDANIYTLSNAAGQHPRTGTYTFTAGRLTMQIDTKGFTEEQKKAAGKRAQTATVQFKNASTMTWHALVNDDEYNSDAQSTLEKQP